MNWIKRWLKLRDETTDNLKRFLFPIWEQHLTKQQMERQREHAMEQQRRYNAPWCGCGNPACEAINRQYAAYCNKCRRVTETKKWDCTVCGLSKPHPLSPSYPDSHENKAGEQAK